jgi:hypothetical protein
LFQMFALRHEASDKNTSWMTKRAVRIRSDSLRLCRSA